RVLPRGVLLERGAGPQDQARGQAGLVDRRLRDRHRRAPQTRAGRRLHVRPRGGSRAGRSLMKRSLWPREHGAYAQLGAPLATAPALHIPTVPAALLAAAACCAFLANEPLLVVLGHRGKRMHDEHGRRAAVRLAIVGGTAVAIGAVALVLAPRDARLVAG